LRNTSRLTFALICFTLSFLETTMTPRLMSLFSFSLLSQLCFAQPTLQPILPENLKWFSPPNNALLKGAWVVGTEKETGLYAFRVALAKGGKIPPHSHPDTRSSTVLSGVLYVGFGDSGDETKMTAIPAGGVYVAPSGVVHYLWAKDGDVVYQENGVGPTATVPVAKP
jgi:quercetin dioxygenase-like cupin family protein